MIYHQIHTYAISILVLLTKPRGVLVVARCFGGSREGKLFFFFFGGGEGIKIKMDDSMVFCISADGATYAFSLFISG